jgi:hypothetical protein
MAMDPSLHPSPAAYWRAQEQSRAMLRRAYREANPTSMLTKIAFVGLVIGGFAFVTMKMRET